MTPKTNSRLIICDFDDTLALERDFIKSGYRHVARFLCGKFGGLGECACVQIFEEEFRISRQGVFDRSVERIFGAPNQALALELVEQYRNHFPRLSYQPDVAEFLRLARERGANTAIITDGNPRTQRNKLEATGALGDFGACVITSEFGPDWAKPSPKAFEFLAEKFGAKFENMVYIGDNPAKDFAVSAKLPIKTAQIERPGAVHLSNEYLGAILPHFRIKRLDQIFGCLGF